MTIWLVYEASERFTKPSAVNGGLMWIVAVVSLIFNIIQIKILHSGDGHYHLGGDDHGHDHGHGGHDHHDHGGHDHHDHGGHDHHDHGAEGGVKSFW